MEIVTVFCFTAAFLIALVIGPVIIPSLERLKFGQSIRTDGPKRHLLKAGTPTMGGIIILLPLILISFFSIDIKILLCWWVLP